MKLRINDYAICVILLPMLMWSCNAGEQTAETTDTPQVSTPVADSDNGGITLPDNFGAVAVVDSLGGGGRHLAVNSNGDIYVKTRRLIDGKGIFLLRDTDNDGKANVVRGFGDYSGTGIEIHTNYLYASSDSSVMRYKMVNNEVPEGAQPEVIVTGLLDNGVHAAKSLALDAKGYLYVNIGAPSNACQEEDRQPGVPGQDPCPWLENSGGIWRFNANKLGQTFEDGYRYSTGIRNAVAIDWNTATNELYGLQHGRDQLSTMWPDFYDDEANAELPSEELIRITEGSDFGWPFCYFDHLQNKKVLGPEYGGDGKMQERCADKDQPMLAFPGHWAPNDILVYTGDMFPAKYKNGAFIAFHGSWNRAPRDQEGYFIVFVPFAEGKPTGKYEVFADGFTGEKKTPRGAAARPCGVAQGPDGSLYVSDSKEGKVWRIMYYGDIASN